MIDSRLHTARVVSSVAATIIALACGTNYVYSAWAPQFADRLHLSATESNLIGLAGNLGMYSMGVPIGIVVDHRGPRPAVIVGALLLGIGYFPFRAAYDQASGSVPLMCLFSYFTGLGGCMAFAAAVKTSALNWPHHRGTATAFPLAAFGLSAFFFSILGGLLFPGDTSSFLTLLAAGTSGLTFAGFFFLRVYPHSSYQPLPTGGAQSLRGSSAEEGKHRASRGFLDAEPGMSPATHEASSTASTIFLAPETDGAERLVEPSSSQADSDSRTDVEVGPSSPSADEPEDANESSSLMSRASSLPGDVLVQNSVDLDRSHRVDIRGWNLLRSLEFWQQFVIMGILSGIGLMTINNIGHNANALWKKYDPSVSEEFLIARQQMHVSILSIGSFSGRLSSGVGSDFLVKVLKTSRIWCLVLASFVFFIAQVCALNINSPHLLGFVSGLSGLGYGFLFGVFPSIVAESFGIHGLSQNWGFMTLSPVISGNIFNLFYGAVFDKHSVVGPGGERSCIDGIACYQSAYVVTLCACGLGLVVTLAVIRHQHLERLREAGKGTAED